MRAMRIQVVNPCGGGISLVDMDGDESGMPTCEVLPYMFWDYTAEGIACNVDGFFDYWTAEFLEMVNYRYKGMETDPLPALYELASRADCLFKVVKI